MMLFRHRKNTDTWPLKNSSKTPQWATVNQGKPMKKLAVKIVCMYEGDKQKVTQQLFDNYQQLSCAVNYQSVNK